MEGDDISTRLTRDGYPRTIPTKPKPIDRIDWSKILEPAPPLPRLSWSTRMQARIEASPWATVAIGLVLGFAVGTLVRGWWA